MHVLLALALQAADPVLFEGLPATLEFQEKEGERRERSRTEALALEAFVVKTQFDDGLMIQEAAGLGFDVKLGWLYHGRTALNINVGYAGWNTENNDDVAIPSDVTVRQYRLGLSGDFPFRIAELGVGITGGVYRFNSDLDDDTSPYLEFEGSIGVRIIPELKVGFIGMITHTQSSFNRSHTHLFTNYSGGLAVEFRF